MRVRDYLNAKYGNGATTILACEARALGIPYPTPSGWLKTYGLAEITAEAEQRLRTALMQSDKPSAKNGLRVLDGLLVANDEPSGKYLFNALKPTGKAHLWKAGIPSLGIEPDTACRMYSTGGLNKHRKGWMLSDQTDREICTMCMNGASNRV